MIEYLVNICMVVMRTGCLDAVPGKVVVGGHDLVGGEALLHAQEPGLVLPVLGEAVLLLAHVGTVRPEELLGELVSVEVDGEEVAVPRAGPNLGGLPCHEL